ncbi:MAG: GNAT family N-acetyltransferase [Clostridia bacterium]|nr:GNAT family N-acetyltransferase [Clostridia bacterium]
MMLKYKNVDFTSSELGEVKALYERSFPQNERREFDDMLKDTSGLCKVLSYWDEDVFIGFACLLDVGSISHIIYFAVKEHLRDKGYGSKILDCIHKAEKGMRVIVDIESADTDCDNRGQRIKRKEFYIRNGYEETQVKYHWHGDDYEIMSFGGDVTRKEFSEFWRTVGSSTQGKIG